MSGRARIALFTLLVALCFAGAYAAGSALDPDIGPGPATTPSEHGDARGH